MTERMKIKTQMYKITKESSPHSTFDTEDLHQAWRYLDFCVCESCKYTYEENLKWINNDSSMSDQEKEDEKNLAKGYSFPENYLDLPVNERIKVLLKTSCGIEYSFEEYTLFK